MAGIERRFAMGWLPDYPDIRDFSTRTDVVEDKLKALGQRHSVRSMLQKVGVEKPGKLKYPDRVDLRQWCSPIEDQGALGSCTAHAAIGLVEYFERRAFGKHIDASRLFLYKVTRNMLQWTGDTGAFIRSAMGALVLFGVPPEEHWPYQADEFEKEPTAFCYAYANNYRAISYYKLDPPGISRDDLMAQIKSHLGAGLPVMFGFTVYSSISQAGRTGMIPYPAPRDRVEGGHAVMAVGYDDKIKVKNTNMGGKETKGALLIRNSWGEDWGDGGYGWLPYDYVLNGLAEDWWALLKNEWVDTGEFKFE